MDKILPQIKEYFRGVLNSYGQIFFSDKIILASFSLFVSLFDFYAGICGLFSVMISNGTAMIMGYNRATIKSGLYGFNSIMVGLGLGVYFQPSLLLMFILVLGALFTLFLSLVFEGVIGKYALPYLSLPFLISLWTISLAGKGFASLGISERGIYTYNDLYAVGGQKMIAIYEWFSSLPILDSLYIYFISLGAIFFQYNVLTGIIMAIGILYYSRIAFSLSLLGFYSAYFFYMIIGSDIGAVTYTYIGFNYILTAIAIGGYFIIPSFRSYLWVVILVPLVAILTMSLSSIFAVYGLSIYSLPFNIVVLMFLYILKLRLTKPVGMTEVLYQQNSPEKNLYSHQNNMLRYKNDLYFPLKLPFWGDWKVTQAHNGEYTHKGEWRHAWDFEIVDDEGSLFKNIGTKVEDYYCYNKAILAPYAGTVEQIIDGIEDNKIGDINIDDNWGNTIVIRHSQYLFTKLCHIKSGTFRVAIGEIVKEGQPLASCGNSGYSPQPHLHFQVQSTPYIDSKTLDYPLGFYVEKIQNKFNLKAFDKPNLDDIVSNIEVNSTIKKAMNFAIGKKLKFEYIQNNITKTEEWEIHVDIYNNPYIYCKKTKSFAYFRSSDSLHLFTNFIGDKKSILFYFYLAFYKTQLSFYKNVEITDTLPINMILKKHTLFLYDFIAPFCKSIKANYKMKYTKINSDFSDAEIVLNSEICVKTFNKKTDNLKFEIKINEKGINEIIVTGNKNFVIKQLT